MSSISKKVLLRCCRIALVVGSILALLNHGDKIFVGQMAMLDWVKIALTYLVPFSVSCYASLANKKELPFKCPESSQGLCTN